MLISCNSCNSKYLVNSAELKPDGRNVQCANCGNQWFQESQVFDDNVKDDLTSEVTDGDSLKQEKNNTSISNLPSTYVVPLGYLAFIVLSKICKFFKYPLVSG